jgi:hypothetical protein
MWWTFLIASLMVFSVVGCSPASTPQATPKLTTANEKQLSPSELLKLYDPSSLVEVKTLHGLPEEVQTDLGAHATGYARIAEVGEECYPTDVHGNDPGRCFLVGGKSDSSALVAFKIGGYAGQSEIARAYVHTKSGWTMVNEWGIGYPNNLRELKEMTGLPPEDYGTWKPK